MLGVINRQPESAFPYPQHRRPFSGCLHLPPTTPTPTSQTMYDLFIAPFAEFSFMRYALASVVFLALSAAPVGVFLVMRRMSLIGDALSHAVLPGAAIGYMIAGLSLPAMGLGGFIAGMLMAFFAGIVSRFTELKEDANFAAFYLTSLAIGVLLVSLGNNSVELLHLLFGSVLAVDLGSLRLMGGVASCTIIALAVMFRPLLLESIDPLFLRSVNGRGGQGKKNNRR